MVVAVFAVALEDGMSIGELGRIYGFSRQRAARYAKEARGDHQGATVPETNWAWTPMTTRAGRAVEH